MARGRPTISCWDHCSSFKWISPLLLGKLPHTSVFLFVMGHFSQAGAESRYSPAVAAAAKCTLWEWHPRPVVIRAPAVVPASSAPIFCPSLTLGTGSCVFPLSVQQNPCFLSLPFSSELVQNLQIRAHLSECPHPARGFVSVNPTLNLVVL